MMLMLMINVFIMLMINTNVTMLKTKTKPLKILTQTKCVDHGVERRLTAGRKRHFSALFGFT